ncbi:MAG: serine/threonine-protein phosphatase [Bacteroidaceae bacterium]|nr:serine/threonine-protein phosphatase [Bacteroidaceae bacterium]
MIIHIAPPLALHELGQRVNQEDALFPPLGMATEADRLFLVCDGMGGHEHGEVASQTVAEAMGAYIAGHLATEAPLTDDLLGEALAAAYDQLDARDNAADTRRMGTTMTLLCLHRSGATMAHIGDSRIYHIRPAGANTSAAIIYQSRDHSLAMDLYLAGELTLQQMATYERRNVITRAMQPAPERRFRPDIVHTTDLRPGDYFLLCSDGVVETLTDDQLLALIASHATDTQKLRELQRRTAAAADNHTAYLVRITSVQEESTDVDAINDEATSRSNLINIIRTREGEAHTAADKPASWLDTLLQKLFN